MSRAQVKDIVYIAGPANVFHHMLEHLGGANSSWEVIEAALFIMQAVARNIDPMESRSVPQVRFYAHPLIFYE